VSITYGNEMPVTMGAGATEGVQIDNTAHLAASDAIIFLGMIGDVSSKLPMPAPHDVTNRVKPKSFCRRIMMQLPGISEPDKIENDDGVDDDSKFEGELSDVVSENMHQELLLNLGVLMYSSAGKVAKELRNSIMHLKEALRLKKKIEIMACAEASSALDRTESALADLDRLMKRCKENSSSTMRSLRKIHPNPKENSKVALLIVDRCLYFDRGTGLQGAEAAVLERDGLHEKGKCVCACLLMLITIAHNSLNIAKQLHMIVAVLGCAQRWQHHGARQTSSRLLVGLSRRGRWALFRK
jgi:hypothetical protein